MTKNTDLLTERVAKNWEYGTVNNITSKVQLKVFKKLQEELPQQVHIYDSVSEYFEEWVNEYHGAYLDRLIYVDSEKNELVTQPTLQLFEDYTQLKLETLEDLVSNGKGYHIFDKAVTEEDKGVAVPLVQKTPNFEERYKLSQKPAEGIAKVVKANNKIQLLILKVETGLVLLLTAKMDDNGFKLQSSKAEKWSLRDEYVNTLQELRDLQHKKELYEKLLNLS